MFKAIKNWWYTLAYEEYELTVWFDDETKVNLEEQTSTTTKSKKVFKLKAITTKKPTQIIGKDMNGKRFEIRTVRPFDYMLRKIY